MLARGCDRTALLFWFQLGSTSHTPKDSPRGQPAVQRILDPHRMSAFVEYLTGLFADPTALQGGEGLSQIIVLLLMYSYVLGKAAKMVADGSELLLLVPSFSGIVGSIILPILGQIPDAVMILFSGLGGDAQARLSVGAGTLAGSTVMLLTGMICNLNMNCCVIRTPGVTCGVWLQCRGRWRLLLGA